MMTTRFDYLLNAFEAASQSANSYDSGYALKRRALREYVRELEQGHILVSGHVGNGITFEVRVSGEPSVTQIDRLMRFVELAREAYTEPPAAPRADAGESGG